MCVEGLALDQLHRDEDLAVGLVDLVDRGDVRVGDGGGGTRLTHEAQPAALVADRILLQHLQRHVAPELLVDRLINDTHPPLTNLLEDAEMG